MSISSIKEKKSSYFSQVKKELKNVTWTSKSDLIASTKIVLLSIFLSGIGIYVLDIIVHNFLKVIGNIIKLIVG